MPTPSLNLYRSCLVILGVIIVLSALVNAQPTTAATLIDVGLPFPDCQTWYIYQGYNNQGGSHSNPGNNSYAFDFVKDNRWDTVGSAGATVVAGATGRFWRGGGDRGDVVTITLDDESQLVYGHLSNVPDIQGVVTKGTPIGTVFDGSYISNWVNHLHFHINDNNNVLLDFGEWNYPAEGPSDGNGVWSGTRIETPCAPTNQAPGVPSVTEPAQGETIYSPDRSVNFSWQDSGDPDNAPRSSRDFFVAVWRIGEGNPVITSPWDTGATWTGILPADGTYEWAIRAGDGESMSDWSPRRSFTITARSLPARPAETACLKPLLRYWNQERQRHVYTSDWSELSFGKNGWVLESVEGYVAATSSCHPKATEPLYRLWNATLQSCSSSDAILEA